jgi:hypothetical protein
VKQKLIKIPDYVFKLPVHEALIEMLNIARESTGYKMIPVEKKGEK